MKRLRDVSMNGDDFQSRKRERIENDSVSQEWSLIKENENDFIIHPENLHFDSEKYCSETMETNNIYACLNCGKFFKGRGPGTPAFKHSIQLLKSQSTNPKDTISRSEWIHTASSLTIGQDEGSLLKLSSHVEEHENHEEHNLFLNLKTGEFWKLPQNDLVLPNTTLMKRVLWNLHPSWKDPKEIDLELSKSTDWKDITNANYFPGSRVLLSSNHAISMVISLLANAMEVRNYFLTDHESITNLKQPLTYQFGELVKFIWNHKSFRSHVSILPLLKEVEKLSRGRFKVKGKNSPVDAMVWMIHTMESELKKSNLPSPFSFFGSLQIKTQIHTARGEHVKSLDRVTPFLFLTCDVPILTFKKDKFNRLIIPEVPLLSLLKKFDGETITMRPSKSMPGYVEHSTHHILKIPNYILIHLQRAPNEITTGVISERSKAIVTFPTQKLDLTFLFKSTCKNASTDSKTNSNTYLNHDSNINSNINSINDSINDSNNKLSNQLLNQPIQLLNDMHYRFIGSISEIDEDEGLNIEKPHHNIDYFSTLHLNYLNKFVKCDSYSHSMIEESSVSLSNSIVLLFQQAF